MSKLLGLILMALIVAAFGYWVAQNSGALIFTIFGYQVETSVVAACFVILTVVIVLYILVGLLTKVAHMPTAIREYFISRRTTKLISLQAQLVGELGLGNTAKVRKLASKVLRYTDDVTLRAQYSVLAGDLTLPKGHFVDDTQENVPLFTNMLVATLIDAERWNDAIAAVGMAFGYDNSLRSEELVRKAVIAYIKLERWQELLTFIEEQSIYLSREQLKTLKAICTYYTAKDTLSEGHVQEIMNTLAAAVKSLPEFHYPLLLLLNTAVKYQIKGDVLTVVQHYCAHHQSASVTMAVLRLVSIFPPEKLYKFGHDLYNANKDSLEAAIIYIYFALNAGLHALAFQTLSQCLSTEGKTLRLCSLMVEFCQRSQADTSEMLEWVRSILIAENDMQSNDLYIDASSLLITPKAGMHTIKLART